MAESEKEQLFWGDDEEEEVVESQDAAAVSEEGDVQEQSSLTDADENESDNGNASTTVLLENEHSQSIAAGAFEEDESTQFDIASATEPLLPEDKTNLESNSNLEHKIVEPSDLTDRFAVGTTQNSQASSQIDVSNTAEAVNATPADYNNDEDRTIFQDDKTPIKDTGSEANKRDSWNPKKWATVKTKYLHRSISVVPKRRSQRYNLIGGNSDLPIFSKPIDNAQDKASQKLSSENVDPNVRRSSKKWALVQTNYLHSRIPERKSQRFNLIGDNPEIPIFSKPLDNVDTVEEAGSDSRRSQRWAPVSTSYLPRASSTIEPSRPRSAVFNIEAGILMDVPIHSKRIDDESSEAIEETIASLDNLRPEHSGKRLSQRWAPVQTEYIQKLPEREFVAEPKPPIPPDAEDVEIDDPSFRGCYLKYISEKYNGALTAIWSPTEVADALFFLYPGPNAGLKDFMYRQRHQRVLQKDLFFSADSHRPNRMFLSGVMDFFKLGKKFDGTIKFKKEKIAELGFKVYFITAGEDVIDLSIDKSAVNSDGITEVEMSNVDAVALVWRRFDDLLGFKKSNVHIFVQRGNLRGNLAKPMSH